MTEEGRRAVHDMVDHLVGSCDAGCGPDHETINETWSPAQRELFYELIFLCECCGWWCSTDELNNLTCQELCDDCAAAEDDD